MIAKITIMNWKKDYLLPLPKYVYCSWDTAPPRETTSFTIKITFFSLSSVFLSQEEK